MDDGPNLYVGLPNAANGARDWCDQEEVMVTADADYPIRGGWRRQRRDRH